VLSSVLAVAALHRLVCAGRVDVPASRRRRAIASDRQLRRRMGIRGISDCLRISHPVILYPVVSPTAKG
jgi:hypothetical protein